MKLIYRYTPRIFSAIFCLLIIYTTPSLAQTGQTFWFAAPEVTSGHVTDSPIVLRMATGTDPATVTISIPADGAFVPLVVNIPANSSHTEDLSAYKATLETMPANTILDNGLLIESTAAITAYYEVNTTFNPDIFALKGENALGTEFYIPLQNFWNNGSYTPTPYTSFDIVATEDNTTVFIYPKTDLVGHSALVAYSITLDRGQTYSAAGTTSIGSDNPAGSVVTSDKPIAITIKDDSNSNGGCRDLIGDQIVPTNVVGTDYIVNQGSVADERIFIVPIANATTVSINGTSMATLFAGETYAFDLTSDAATSFYIEASNPVYLLHVSGFGCEMGGAILPPLNCAGSEQIYFTRSTTEYFGLNLLVRSGSEGDFELNGDPNLIQAGDFSAVPGTAGEWMAAQVSFNTTDIPVGSSNLLTNSTEIFSMGIINGGATSGCRYGYFSEFVAEIIVDAGVDQMVCANKDVDLNGSITGGATSGSWASSGTGSFSPNNTDFNATYQPSVADIANGTVTLTLTSSSICFPVQDDMVVTFTPAPTVDAGIDQSVCANNPDVTLNANITVASGGLWSGGLGTFTPNNTDLNAVYTPNAAEIAAGTVTLTLTSTGNGICDPESDDIIITITDAPTVNAGVDINVCENNATVNLSGSLTIATGGIWSGGSGVFNPSNTDLNATYTPSAAEISAGGLTLTLTTTGNGNCTAVADQVDITIDQSPIANAGVNQILCANNADVTLNGSVVRASGGTWSGGLGTFSPDNNTLNAVYTPTPAEITAGSVNLTLTTTGNGNCTAESDIMTISFTSAPTADAGVDQSVCENNPDINLSGSVTVANGGTWSGGTGTFTPNNTDLNAVYTPSAAEITAGTVTLTLTTTGNGSCIAVNDDMTITITDAPTANAGVDINACENNATVSLNGSITVASGGIWSGGVGVFNPSNTAVNATYTPTAGEIAAGSLTLTLTTTGNGNCIAVSDQVDITFDQSPVANAGANQTVCANNADVTLNGSVARASGGIWSGGFGTFTPNNTTLNAVYTPTAAEIGAGNITLTLTTTGNGNCIAVSDDMTITVTDAPTADAGVDQTVCANNPDVSLAASVTVATGGTWSGGSGSFSPNNASLNAVYTPSAAEITAGTVTLTLTTFGNGDCIAVTDDITITITDSPIVSAGVDLNSCITNPTVVLSGFVQNVGGGQWTGGTGVFNPSSNDLNASYTPSAAEIAAGTVTLTLTSTGNGNCNPESDQVTISINSSSPTVEAGVNQTVCANNPDATLAGNISFASGGVWSGGLGLFTPDNTTLNAVYTPTTAELDAGSVTLTLTSTGNGGCLAASDVVTIIYDPAPEVDAGIDQTVCESNPSVTLNGAVTVANGGIWSGGLGSFTPNNTTLNAVYNPTATEIQNGSLDLILTTTGNGICTAVTDTLQITFSDDPVVDAGPNQSVCVDELSITLSGAISGVTNTGIWSTSGSGVFVPNNTTLNATYVASTADSLSGSFTLTLTSTNNQGCNPVQDAMEVSILPAGTVDAGSNQTVCANNNLISLNGVIGGGATTGIWSTSGTGYFADENDASTFYYPSDNDNQNGTVTLTLTADACNGAAESIEISITPAPSVLAGDDITICESVSTTIINGSISGGATEGIWTTTGTGTFSPSNTSLAADYEPSAADIQNGGALLILTTTNHGSCLVVRDTLQLNIYPSGLGTPEAGSDINVCTNNLSAELNGSITGGISKGTWTTSGTGVFVPSDTVLNATYHLSGLDLEDGSVKLYLRTNSCDLSNSDSLTVTVIDAPVVSAGDDQVVCRGSNVEVELAGAIEAAAGATWTSSGTGTFDPIASSLNATYILSQEDQQESVIYLYLTTTGNGVCNADTDTLEITFSNEIEVDAGADQNVCSQSDQTQLRGEVTNGSNSGSWISSGTGGFVPSNETLDAVYLFSDADKEAGAVTLRLTSTNNGACDEQSDEMVITFGNSVFTDAGDDFSICANNLEIQLDGFVTGGATTGEWQTLGTGFFSPDAQALDAVYVASAADSIAGFVDLVLSSTNNGTCLMGTDTVTINIDPAVAVDAGLDEFICYGTAEVELDGKVTNAAGATWSTNGSGSFEPNEFDLNARYQFSFEDQSHDELHFILTSISNCNTVRDTVFYEIKRPLSAEFQLGNACVDELIQFTDSTTINEGTITAWAWNFGDGLSSSEQHPTHIYAAERTYEVMLVVTSNLGCTDTISKNIEIFQTADADFEIDQKTFVVGDSIFLTNSSAFAETYKWDFGDEIGTASAQNTVYQYNTVGEYEISLIAINPNGCQDTVSTFVTIEEQDGGSNGNNNGSEVFPPKVPSGFSPNGDQKNDVLVVKGGPFESLVFSIYNGWGELVFQSADAEQGWDGTKNGSEQPVGVYVYTLKAKTTDGNFYQRTGETTLIR